MSIDYSTVIKDAQEKQDYQKRIQEIIRQEQIDQEKRMKELERQKKIQKNIQVIAKSSLEEMSENWDYFIGYEADECTEFYRPYRLDLKTILYRLENDLEVDSSNRSHLIKLALSKQLAEMEELPSLDTECFIGCPSYFKKEFMKKKGRFERIKYRLFGGASEFNYTLVFLDCKATFEELRPIVCKFSY